MIKDKVNTQICPSIYKYQPNSSPNFLKCQIGHCTRGWLIDIWTSHHSMQDDTSILVTKGLDGGMNFVDFTFNFFVFPLLPLF